MNDASRFNKKILLAVLLGALLLAVATLLAFLYLSDAFRKPPVVEIFPDNIYEETLVVVTDIDYEPFSYVDENGDYAGLDVELIAEIASRLQMNLDLTLLDWTQANELFFGGKADAFLNMETDLIAGDDRMIATLPTAEKQYVVYGRQTVSSVPELYGKKVASLHRMPELGLDDITYFDSYAEIFDALNRGAFDFGICPIQVGNVFLEKMQMTDVKPSYAVSHIYGAIALSPENTALKARMDSVISDLKKEGFLDRLDAKWVSNRYQSMTLTGMIRSHPMVGAGFFAGLVLLVLLLFFLLALNRRNEDLRLAKERAEESARAKSVFLSNMSHEIRTPINAVLGMNELILREVDGREAENASYRQIASCAVNVESAGKNLLSIINDILDFSKIDAGKMEVVPAAYKFGSVLNDVTTIATFRARDKGLTFSVDADETLPDGLYGDEVRLRQILTNVLGNAVKYTKQGAVSLSVTGEKTAEDAILLTFTVKDTGVGIKEEDLGRLFGKFERMDLAKNKTIEGTGLGLAITKSLLDLMDGDIAVESVYGEGSTFTVTVPQKVVAWDAIGDFKEKFERAMINRPHYRETLHAPDAKLLVVDDTQMNLTVVEGLLEQTKAQLSTALSGADALKLTAQTRFDLIFMDQMMPQMDGTEALRAIRAQADGQNQETPVICLTADAISGAREKYLAEGFTDYLSKPIEGSALEEALKRYLPPEKISLEETGDDDRRPTIDAPDTPSALKTFYDAQPSLDYDEAVSLCASETVLEKTLKQFYLAITENASAIDRYLHEKDYQNYTIKVHALKSSARLIGADALSGAALKLELCGKDLSENAVKEIEETTPALLASYRALGDLLQPLYTEEAAQKMSRPEMTKEELDTFYDAVRDAVNEFDSDALDRLIEDASRYRLPDAEQARFSQIAAAARDMDWGALEEALT